MRKERALGDGLGERVKSNSKRAFLLGPGTYVRKCRRSVTRVTAGALKLGQSKRFSRPKSHGPRHFMGLLGVVCNSAREEIYHGTATKL